MGWALGVSRGKALLLAGALLATVALAILATANARAAGDGRTMSMLLRLRELPPEYQIGDDSGCGPFDFEGTQAMAEFTERYHPRGCYFEYERLFHLSGTTSDPPLVGTLAVTTPSVEAAEAGNAIVAELLGYATGDEKLEEVAPQATVGDATRLFHVDDALVRGRRRQTGSALFWRSGSVMATIYVAGRPSDAADRIALRLARRQQVHVENPTSYTRAQRDDTLVPLGNPRIDVPVFWLGREFKPGHGLPASSLRDVLAPIGAGEGPPGMRVLLHYDGVSLGTWTRASWRRYSESSLGQVVRRWDCTKARTLELPNGQGTIYAGYTKSFSSCPRRRPDVFLAEVHFGDVVVGVNLPNCTACVEAGNGPYDSRRGLEAVIRALRLRPPPVRGLS